MGPATIRRLPGKYWMSGESTAESALPATEAWGIPRASATRQPPYSIDSLMIRSGLQVRAIASRSGTMCRVETSAKTVTTKAANSGPGGGICGNAVHVEWSAVSQSKPASMCVRPKASTSGRNDAAEATATSWPASFKVVATGTRG
jgi:hypothetical protein